jgi:MFS family permease
MCQSAARASNIGGLSTFLAPLMPLAQAGPQLLVVRVLTGFGLDSALSASFPIAAELMSGPPPHLRRDL